MPTFRVDRSFKTLRIHRVWQQGGSSDSRRYDAQLPLDGPYHAMQATREGGDSSRIMGWIQQKVEGS